MADSTADYIIVGGGLTGCVIASRLQQNLQHKDVQVTLIEAGPDPSGNLAAAGFLSGLSLQGGELDYAYQSEAVAGTAGRSHTLNAGRALGGGSILNYGGWLRADAADYDEWARAVGDQRWGHEGLGPWLRKTESFHGSRAEGSYGRGTDGPMNVTTVSASESGQRRYPLRDAVRDAWASLGVAQKNPGEGKDGSIAGLVEMSENSSRDGGQRQPSYMAYPLDGVRVLTNTVCTRVLFSGTTATGVELAGGQKITARREVILCAGSYHTPQLLMLSGVGPAETLAEHNIPAVKVSPHVGSNLHDHFAVYLAFRLRDPSLGYAMGSPAWPQNPALFKGLPWDWVVSQPLPDGVLSRLDEQKHKHWRGRNLWEVLTLYVPPGIPGIPMDGTHIATSTMLLLPTSRGTVTIRSADAADPPLVRPAYFSTPIDRAALVHATRRTLQAVLATQTLGSLVEGETPPSVQGQEKDLGELGLTPLTATSTDAEIEDRIRRTGTQHHHSGGTAAMGAVVDAEGRVIGVDGLRVADASVIPVPLGGHPQATLYAMAEQVAAMVVGAC